MPWIEPKTNWTRNDYINVSDYNRIAGNIEYLRSMFFEWGYGFTITHTGESDEERRDMLFVLNSIEDNVETIAQNTFLRPDYAGKVVQIKNTELWNADDLNRIERNILGFYKTLRQIIGGAYGIPLYCGAGLIADKVAMA